MLRVLTLLLAFDPPAYDTCASVPWQGASSIDGVRLLDHPLGDFEGHEARARVCLEDSGYGYTRVSFVIWVEQDDRSWTTLHLEHGMTACPEVSVRRNRDVVALRTSTCSYFDEAPTGAIRTRLRWESHPPSLR